MSGFGSNDVREQMAKELRAMYFNPSSEDGYLGDVDRIRRAIRETQQPIGRLVYEYRTGGHYATTPRYVHGTDSVTNPFDRVVPVYAEPVPPEPETPAPSEDDDVTFLRNLAAEKANGLQEPERVRLRSLASRLASPSGAAAPQSEREERLRAAIARFRSAITAFPTEGMSKERRLWLGRVMEIMDDTSHLVAGEDHRRALDGEDE